MDEIAVRTLNTPLGTMVAKASTRGLQALAWCDSPPENHPASGDQWIQTLQNALSFYWQGNASAWLQHTQGIPLDLAGSPFQRAIWNRLRQIPWGKSIPYGVIAAELGRRHGARAVGGACGANPILLLIPCHRVVSVQGLGGYAAGIKRKRWLLDHESGAESHSF